MLEILPDNLELSRYYIERNQHRGKNYIYEIGVFSFLIKDYEDRNGLEFRFEFYNEAKGKNYYYPYTLRVRMSKKFNHLPINETSEKQITNLIYQFINNMAASTQLTIAEVMRTSSDRYLGPAEDLVHEYLTGKKNRILER